jgi:capsular exopolysaccharide synthesis family protein
MYLLEREAVKTIMVTSPREGEGKTTLAINIAVCFSQFYRRVLLVDCNFKSPAASRLIRPAGEMPELAEYVNEFAASPVRDLGIDVVLNGMIPREQPIVDYTLLASMIETLKDSYDLIILDCPPILNNADIRMLSYIAKNAVIVADYRRLSRWLIENSIHRLTQIDVKILGVILNRVPKRKIL